jgi:hypothetical protein
MSRVVLRLVLDVVLTIAVALAGLTGYQLLIGGSIGEGARVLFNFMDVGLAIWLILLIVFTVRWRGRGGVPAGVTFLFLLIGAVLNAIVVLVVGFTQGGAGPWLVMFALVAGVACLLAASIVLPIVHRLVKASATTATST